MKATTKTQRIISVILTLLMAVSLLSVNAFALNGTDTGTITVENAEQGVTVTAYRLMTANVNANGQPADPEYTWDSAVADWVRTNYSTYIGTGTDNSVKKPFSPDNDAPISDAEVAAFYDALASAIRGGTVTLSAAKTATTDSSGKAILGGLSMGNYLILVEGGMRVYRPAAANLVPKYTDDWAVAADPATVSVAINLKSSEPSIDKKIVGSGYTDETENANIGDTVKFELNSAIPTYPAKAITKQYWISDKVSDGLTFDADSLKVYGVNGSTETPLAKGTAFTQSTTRPTGTGDERNVTFALSFDYDKIKSYESIKVTYSAVLNKDAVTGADGNQNTAYLDYNNNPYQTTSWKTKDDETTVYTYGIEVVKVDEKETTKPLAGAEFSISDGTTAIQFSQDANTKVYYKDVNGSTTLTTGSDGKINVKGLDEGTYTLTETKAPGGYLLPTNNTVEVKIVDKDASNVIDGKIAVPNANGVGTTDEGTGIVSKTITNTTGFRLPQTGGLGTVVFTMIGILLMGAGIALVVVTIARRRRG